MKESALLHTILLAAPTLGARLMRNNVGTLQDVRGNYVKYGLAVGSSDLIGWTVISGRAIFTAVECKLPGKRPTVQQQQFLDAVTAAGGIATVAYSVKDVQQAIEAYRAAR
jgi:hypothetical protein